MPIAKRTSAEALALIASVIAAAGAAGAAGSRPGPAAPSVVAGRYAVRATLHVEATPLPSRDGDAELDVVVAPGAAPDGVVLRATSRGYACELAARLRGAGELGFEGGQSCAVEVAEPEARGRLDARLRSGRGHLADGALQLDLAFDLSGALSTRISGRRVTVLGNEVALPEGWTPMLPVRGALTTSANGQRASAAPPPGGR